ncbi:MAG: SagB/ThcOx family dehydrogenase [Planctomycetota bacterium]
MTDLAMELPPPSTTGKMPLEQAIANRRSVRSYIDKPLTAPQISQLCWAGQGVTEPREKLRAAPSAGATYPIELYVATAVGVGHYRPHDHTLRAHLDGDARPAIQRASLNQEMIGQAAACFAMAAVVSRVAAEYGSDAEAYTLLEVGHAAQNMLLEAEALGLAGVPVGAFDDKKVGSILELPREQRVFYMLPIGYRAS